MKKIIIGVVALLVIGGGAGAFFFLMGDDADATATAEGGDPAAEVVEEPVGDPIYLALRPEFLVNFDHNGTIRYLQLELQVMGFDQEVIDKVEANMPAVRNKIILLLSDKNYDALSTVEGKDALRGEVLAAVNEAVGLEGKTELQDVFFTNFIIQ